MKLLSLLSRRPSAATYTLFPRLALQASGSALLAEHVMRPEHVYEDEAPLLTLQAAGRTIELRFLPRKSFREGQTRARVNSPASFAVLSDGTELWRYEMPELTERANYQQLVKLDQYRAVLADFRDAVRATGGSAKGMPGWGVALLVVLGLLSSILLFANPQPQGAAPAPKQLSAAPAEVQLSTGDQLNTQEKNALALVVKQSGIELSTGGKPFVVFSDPNCPACRELEGKLATVDKSLSPIIVPVSFKPNSREAVAGVLCAKDVAAAWRAAAAGGPAAPGCSAGSAQAEANNATFVALKFDRTPTIVTSTGKVAVGAKDFDGLMRWIRENSGG